MPFPITGNKVLDNLDWHFKTVLGRDGLSYELLVATPTESFWALRKEFPEELKRSGIKATQYNRKWTVSWWRNSDGNYTIPILQDIKRLPELDLAPLVNEENIKDFQIPLTQQCCAGMREYGVYLNACGTGVGKTYITLATAREFGFKLVVVCPKTITRDWKRAAFLMGVEVESYGWEWVKTGKTPYGKWHGKEFIWEIPDRTFLVFDEVHRASGMNTQNSKLLIGAKNQAIRMFMLSATVANDPTKMRGPGYALGLHNDKDFFDWMKAYGCKLIKLEVDERKIREWKFSGNARDLQRIHASIFPRKGCRVTADQLGDKFPDTQIEAKAYDMDESGKIQSTYAEMEKECNRIFIEEPKDKRHASIVAEYMKARMKVELLKVPLFVSLTKDYIEEGNSIFIAVNFKDTLRELEKQLKIKAVIEGTQKDFDRQNAIDDFQSNKVNIIAGIIQACREGINLHDVIGGHPRVALIAPTPNPIDLKQVLGRTPRIGGKTPSIQRILYVADTIEEKVVEGLATKLDQLDLLMDGQIMTDIFPSALSRMRNE